MDQIDRLIQQRFGQGGSCRPDDKGAAETFPLLFDGMTRVEANDRFMKEPWIMEVRMGVGCWIATLRDRTLKMSLQVSAGSILDVFEAIETELKKPFPSWIQQLNKDPVMRKKKKPDA